MLAATEPPRATRHRRRALAILVALGVALATAGCSDPSAGQSSSGPPLVTGEQVVTSCFHNYFYNGILPKAAAESNCTSCVVQQLGKLGIRPSPGENVIDMLTGDRLSNADIQKLQSTCNITDAASQ